MFYHLTYSNSNAPFIVLSNSEMIHERKTEINKFVLEESPFSSQERSFLFVMLLHVITTFYFSERHVFFFGKSAAVSIKQGQETARCPSKEVDFSSNRILQKRLAN